MCFELSDTFLQDFPLHAPRTPQLVSLWYLRVPYHAATEITEHSFNQTTHCPVFVDCVVLKMLHDKLHIPAVLPPAFNRTVSHSPCPVIHNTLNTVYNLLKPHVLRGKQGTICRYEYFVDNLYLCYTCMQYGNLAVTASFLCRGDSICAIHTRNSTAFNGEVVWQWETRWHEHWATLTVTMLSSPTSTDSISCAMFFKLYRFSPQHMVIGRFGVFVSEAPEEGGLRSVLSRLCSLYALWSLSKHISTLYQGKPCPHPRLSTPDSVSQLWRMPRP